MKILPIVRSPYTSLTCNFVYAIGNCIIGLLSHSFWFLLVGAYYITLATTRFCVLQIKRKSGSNSETEQFAKSVTGILLIILSFWLIGINILSAVKERGSVYHKIIMIAIATYTFTKITLAIIGMVRAQKSTSSIVKTLRNISLAEAFVSVYALQRSMLVSFPGMQANEIQLFNILTGSAVWLIVLLLGVNLIGGKHVNMAKSKLVTASEKIADTLTDGYKKIEKGVVNGYQKVEQSVVSGYTKIEDKFVSAYLAKDGETIEEAKARLKEKK